MKQIRIFSCPKILKTFSFAKQQYYDNINIRISLFSFSSNICHLDNIRNRDYYPIKKKIARKFNWTKYLKSYVTIFFTIKFSLCIEKKQYNWTNHLTTSIDKSFNCSLRSLLRWTNDRLCSHIYSESPWKFKYVKTQFGEI